MWAFKIGHKSYNYQIKGAEKFKGDDRFWNREALKIGSRWGKNAAIENGFKYFYILRRFKSGVCRIQTYVHFQFRG